MSPGGKPWPYEITTLRPLCAQPGACYGVAPAPWAGAEPEPDAEERVAEGEFRLGLDDDDEVDDELLDVGDAESESSSVSVGSAAELSAGVVVAGAVVVGEDGVVGVVFLVDEALVRSPIVVPPEVCALVTSAETGFWPISSMPVTMSIATTNTAAA